MHFTRKAPCDNCPFRKDVLFHGLHPSRVPEFLEGTFACHKSVDYSHEDEEDGSASSKRNRSQEIACAGALILLEKEGGANQMGRIAQRLGLYDPNILDMTAPVYESREEMMEAFENQ